MDEKTFQFALLAATLVGTAVAIIVGKMLDKNEQARKIISIDFDKSSQVIDFSKRNILLAPNGIQNPIPRVFERELSVTNVGFGLVEGLEIVWGTNYVEKFGHDRSWADFDLRSEPPGIRPEFEDLEKSDQATRILMKFKFLNRGDKFVIRAAASSDFSFDISAHHPGTEIRYQGGQKLLPTFRDRVAKFLSEKQIIQVLAGVGAAAAAGSISSIIGN